jgi:hypothetical protein
MAIGGYGLSRPRQFRTVTIGDALRSMSDRIRNGDGVVRHRRLGLNRDSHEVIQATQ